MHDFYGACVVIVGRDDCEAIGWCCRCKEFAKNIKVLVLETMNRLFKDFYNF
jgi:hypothetical protein